MRRAELLIKQVQRATENERVGSQDGISLEEYYQYLTDGAHRFQMQVVGVSAEAFRAEQSYTASGSEYYALPGDILLRNQVISVEYSPTGLDKDYWPLTRVISRERFTFQGVPSRYFLQGGRFYVNCYPVSGSFRVVYNQQVPTVDKRRATVSSHTKSTTALTALTLTGFTSADYALADHLTIVDFNGTVKMRGIPYTAVNSGTGVVSIQNSSYTFPTGSTIANGDYVCLGEFASSHALIDTAAEPFLLAYCSRRILMRDSSQDTAELTAEEMAMIKGIVDAYAQDPDPTVTPIVEGAYFGEFF